MTEHIRAIKFSIHIDTTEKTIEKSFDTFEELRAWWEEYGRGA